MLTAMVPTTSLSNEDVMLGKLLFTSLILYNATSNRDGFGIASTGNTSFKTTKPAQEVLYSNPCITAVTKALPEPFIGHVRTTSTGRTAKDGSHPFFVNSLAVAHNGTFSNYRGLLKENKDISKAIDDPDPVDSNVFAHLLAKVKGGGPLTSDHIETALKEIEGSYALLVAEENQDFIWVVRGINGLYQATVGPYQVVNTSKINLENAVQETANTFKLLLDLEFKTPEVTVIPTFGVYKLSASGLVKQSELPKPAVVTYDYTGWQGTQYRYLAASSRTITSETAITIAALAVEITTIPGITYKELEIATDHLCEEKWCKVKKEDLLIVQQTLEVLSSRHHTAAKEFVWRHIIDVVGDSPYEATGNILTLMGSGNEIYFPYFLHTVEELETILNLIRGGDNVIIS